MYALKMTGETNLQILLQNMQPALDEATYVFVAAPANFHNDDLKPRFTFQETEGQTLVISLQDAERYGFDYQYPCRMITLKIHSSLEAVGFLAAITAKLAAAGISVNAVSAFYHDHLFVPVDKAEQSMQWLTAFTS